MFIHTVSFCQEVTLGKAYLEGKVFSGINKKPLTNATVYIKNTSYGTVTDSTGYFKVKVVPSGNRHLIISYFGYTEADTVLNITSQPISNIKISLDADCPFNLSVAENDIANGKPKLLLVGSIVPVIYTNQHKFEKKYKVSYFDFGCTPPAYECIEEYNKKIFSYLDKKYGDKWRLEVRPDVEYLTK